MEQFTFDINPFKRDKGEISIKDVHQGTEQDQPFFMQLDFSQLSKGNYDLRVRVSDLVASETREKKIAFELK